MMRHIELNFYWLYEYIRGDGSKFVTTEELDELEMVLNDAKLKNKVQIHYEAEQKSVDHKHNNMLDAWKDAEKYLTRNSNKSNLTFVDSWLDPWTGRKRYLERKSNELITPLVGPGDGLTIKNYDEFGIHLNSKQKAIYSIMEVVSEDGRLSVMQVFSFDTECEAEIVLDYVNELEPERKFYIREGQGE
ncbi:hypothetical protein [Trichococcus collinsii]|uniref:Uncharacterized protein n=1 Tax=Trichococcus collinsii TaxID=157076 RepID=A0AB38A409_9LACT|nr:hypothetical protein [Trichococcus collinsii]CZR10915.1 Hypothetical protein Tcol_3122 [Trichococcus collinsii]SEA96067.1 hypothetical protein SAMN04488525_11332 [Trichococcus collinsii]